MRKFFLNRITDISGVSGTGIVAEGIQFSDGQCVIHWLTDTACIGIYKSIKDIEKIHGHEGSTKINWDRPNSIWCEMHEAWCGLSSHDKEHVYDRT